MIIILVLSFILFYASKIVFLNNYFRIKFIKVWLTISIRANQFWIIKHFFHFFIIVWSYGQLKYICCDAYEWCSNTHFQCFVISIISIAWFYESCKNMISNLNVWLWKSQEIIVLVCMFIYLFVWRWLYIYISLCVCVCLLFNLWNKCWSTQRRIITMFDYMTRVYNKRLIKFLPNGIKILYVSILLF